MSYQVILPSPATPAQILVDLQQSLSNPALAGWNYLYGELNGISVPESVWAEADPAIDVTNGACCVFQLPSVGGDLGVVGIHYLDDIYFGDEPGDPVGPGVFLAAFPGGWQNDPAGPKELATTLGGLPCFVAADNYPIEEIRLFVNSRRAIISCRDGDSEPLILAYVGFIQSHYTDGVLGVEPDPNPLLVTGGNNRIPSNLAPMQMLSTTNVPISYKCSVPFRTDDNTEMLEAMQYNTRTTLPTRSLFPCVVGCDAVGMAEIRGELEGVFHYGPTDSLALDTVVTRGTANYLVIDHLALGPIT